MLRSMFSAISGLRSHQIMMDVIGNNISNVNTNGFKSARVTFQDILSQQLRGGSSPNVNLGGINPAQIGLGMNVAGIDVLHSQGNLQATGKMTDLAIQGDGFFILSDGRQQVYTRDGAFDISLDGRLINPANGMTVQGWNVNAAGGLDTGSPVTDVLIPLGRSATASATTNAAFRGNLDSRAAVGATATTTVNVYDSLGVRHAITVTYTKTGANAWSWAASTDPADTSVSTTSTGTLTFDSAGALSASTGTLSIAVNNGSSSPITPALDFSDLTQLGGASDSTAVSDGFPSGTLVTFAVGGNGEITGVFSNGQTQLLGQIALGSFYNPSGLVRVGQNGYQESAASGSVSVGTPATGTRGSVTTGALEMSNVDLATQFTAMITAQRGFQANGRVITTSDEMLQELVNLKR